MTAEERKQRPVYSGVLAYFPDALQAVAQVSWMGNAQHNPGEPLHWARHKSTDQLDAATRHLIDHAKGITVDTDGGYHLAKAAWRVLAELQLVLEEEARVRREVARQANQVASAHVQLLDDAEELWKSLLAEGPLPVPPVPGE